MTTRLPKDDDGNAIPAMRPSGAAHSIAVTGTAAENATAFNSETRVISLYSTTDLFYKLGTDDTVTATTSDHFFPAGVYYDLAIGGDLDSHYPYISFIRASEDGTVYVSEKE